MRTDLMVHLVLYSLTDITCLLYLKFVTLVPLLSTLFNKYIRKYAVLKKGDNKQTDGCVKF
jgi:hypothetical protein